jgi:hypothetical protein
LVFLPVLGVVRTVVLYISGIAPAAATPHETVQIFCWFHPLLHAPLLDDVSEQPAASPKL